MICVWNDSPAPGIKQGAYITIEGSRSKLDYYKNNRLVNSFPFPTFAKTFTSPLVRYDNLIHTGTNSTTRRAKSLEKCLVQEKPLARVGVFQCLSYKSTLTSSVSMETPISITSLNAFPMSATKTDARYISSMFSRTPPSRALFGTYLPSSTTTTQRASL